MTTPLDPYATGTSALPSATQSIIPASGLGLNNATINTSDLNVSSAGGGVVLGYAGSPGVGNLYFSLSPTSTMDTFGNTISTGLSVNAGNLTGVSLVGVQMDSTSTLQNTQINQANVLTPTITGGTAASMVQTMTNTGGGVLGYVSSSSSVTFSTNGNYQWTAPSGITQAAIACWGAGAGGGGGGSNGGITQGGESGGGGEYAGEPNFSILPGTVYSIIVGNGGNGGSTGFPGQDGTETVFQNVNGGGSVVLANPGLAGVNYVGGVGGSGSTNSVHFDGGDGANADGITAGAGGGGSAGSIGPGADGFEASSPTGPGSPGAGGAGGGAAGGVGGQVGTNGTNGAGPGGGGGGAGYDNITTGSFTYSPNDNATYSYYGQDAEDGNSNKLHDGPNGPLYVGYPLSAGVPADYGHQYSFIPFPYGTMMSNLSGKIVTSVSLKIKCLYTYYSSGVYCVVSTYGLSAFGNTATPTPRDTCSTFLIKQGVTVTQNLGLGVGGTLGTNIQSGAARSFMLGTGGVNDNTPEGDYYGSFDDGENNGVQPKIIINYADSHGSTAGSGSDGQCIITYNASSVPTYSLSVSASQSADVFGNPYNQGFTGPQMTFIPSAAQTTISTAVNVNSNSSATSLTVTTSTSYAGGLPAVQIDPSPHTNTNNSGVLITKGWIIPPGDAQLGTTYKLEVPFSNVYESETVRFVPSINGTTINTSGGDLTGAASFTAGATLVGKMTMLAVCTSQGTSGQFQFYEEGGIGVITNRSTGSNTNFLWLSSQNTGQAINTMVANTIGIAVTWGGSNGSQNVVGNFSVFTRMGP